MQCKHCRVFSHVAMTPGYKCCSMDQQSQCSINHVWCVIWVLLFQSTFVEKGVLYFEHKELDMDLILSNHVRQFNFSREFIDVQEQRLANWVTLPIHFIVQSLKEINSLKKKIKHMFFYRHFRGKLEACLSSIWIFMKSQYCVVKYCCNCSYRHQTF